jgi:putative oxidoreductase
MTNQPDPKGVAASTATLLLRLTTGAAFVAHALLKLLVLTLPGTAAFFAAHGFPGWTAYPVFMAELTGGVALLLGLHTRAAAAALTPVLLGAFTVHWPNGWYFAAQDGGWEYLAVLLANLVALAVLGDGRFSVAALKEKS